MPARRLLLAVTLALTLLAIGSAHGQAAPKAKGTVIGSGTKYTIRIVNLTAEEKLKCFQYRLPQPVLAKTPGTGPSDWQFSTNGQVIAGQSQTGIPPGGDLSLTFPTTGPYPLNSTGQLKVSFSCAPGSDVNVPVTRQGAGAGPCACERLFVDAFDKLPPVRIQTTPKRLRISLAVQWRLFCEGGAPGSTCSGLLNLELTPQTKRAGLSLQPIAGPPRNVVTCKGRCGEDLEQSLTQGSRSFAIMGDQAFRQEQSSRRTVVSFEVESVCGKRKKTRIFDIALDAGGKLNRSRSDLNGNGTPDGKER